MKLFCSWALLLIVLSDDSANTVVEKLKSTSLKRTTSAGVADVEGQAVSSEDRGLRLESLTASDYDENAVWDSTPPKSNDIPERDVQTENDVQFSNKIINPDTKYSITYLVQKLTKTTFTLDTGKWSPVSLIGAVCFYLTLFCVLCICITIMCSAICHRRRKVKEIREERLLESMAEEL